MVRTQIQLPEDLYARLKAVANAKEWSVAEAFRRGVEMLVTACPKPAPKDQDWQLPGPFDMGKPLADESEWNELANVGHILEQLQRDRKL